MDDKLMNILYPTKEDKYTEEEIKKIVCETVRQHIIKKNYKFNIKDYYIDLHPNNLTVEYKTKDTKIEISTKEILFETTNKKNDYAHEKNLIRIIYSTIIEYYDNYISKI